MAIMSKQHNAIFLGNPGTGSTAMEKLLIQDMGWTQCGQKHDGYDKLQAATGLDLSTYFVFTTVRNPFDFFASEYSRFRNSWARKLRENPDSWIRKNESVKQRIAIAEEGDFPRFVNFYLSNGQMKAGRWREEYWDKASFVMRTESLQLDLNNVQRVLSLDGPIKLPRVNVTPDGERQDKQELFTPELVALLELKFSTYLEMFSYGYDSRT